MEIVKTDINKNTHLKEVSLRYFKELSFPPKKSIIDIEYYKKYIYDRFPKYFDNFTFEEFNEYYSNILEYYNNS